MAKRFFYVSAGLLMLALTYHLGARSAGAQAGATGYGFTYSAVGGMHLVITPNGDVYGRRAPLAGQDYNAVDPTIHYLGNFWGGATSAAPSTWGRVKADYRK